MPKSATKNTAKTRTMAYDVAQQPRTPEEMAAYLDAWLDEAPDHASGIAIALGDIARAKGMTQCAHDAGLSRESLYKAQSVDGNPSFATVLKVARALGVKLHAAAAWVPMVDQAPVVPVMAIDAKGLYLKRLSCVTRAVRARPVLRAKARCYAGAGNVVFLDGNGACCANRQWILK